MPFHEPCNLSYNQDKRSGNYYSEPVLQLYWHYIEHFTTETHYKHLTDQYKSGDKQEAVAVFEVKEITLAQIRFRIEHIPKLHKYENGEEKAFLIIGQVCRCSISVKE